MYCTVFNTASSAAPQIPDSEDAGIEPMTVATSAMAVRRSNHSARSHPFLEIYVHFHKTCQEKDIKIPETYVFEQLVPVGREARKIFRKIRPPPIL
jgi:hypothetical protein